MSKRRQTLKCPECKIEVRASRLDAHMKNVHPGVEARPRSKRTPMPRSMMPAIIATIAVVSVLVAAGVGLYYLNLPEPEEEDVEPPVIPPVASGVYPTVYARIEVGERGSMIVGLYGNETPKTVKNFVDLVNQHYFVGTVFHRIVPGFVIQGGGFNPDLTQKKVPFPPINLEINSRLHNLRGTLSMARTGDPNSATTQFFVNLVDNSPGKLDPDGYSKEGYAVFGVVVQGMEVVDKIATVPTETPQGGSENSQPIQAELHSLIITNTMLVAGPDG